MGASSIINPITVMRHHLQSTINYTNCICRPNTGGQNRYIQAASRIGCGIANALGAGQMNSLCRRCITDLFFDSSAHVFYCMVHPRINRRLRRTEPCGGVRTHEPCKSNHHEFSECESTEAEVQYLKRNSSVRRSRFSRHGIPAVKQNYQVIRPQRSGIMPLFTRYSGCDSGIPYNPRHDSGLEAHIVSDKIRMRLSPNWILQSCVKLRHLFLVAMPHPLISAYFVFTE